MQIGTKMDKYYLLSLPDNEADAETNFNDSRYVNLNFSKTGNDLFKEEEDVKHKIVNVKRINLPHKGEDWEIIEDGKVVLTLHGTRFTKTEKDFLKTVDGMKFLIKGYKSGIKSVVKFKKTIKSYKK